MSNELLQKLERKIENAVETIELLKLQIDELQQENVQLTNENAAFKNKQINWEKTLNLMLDKLSSVSTLEQQFKNTNVNMEVDKEDIII